MIAFWLGIANITLIVRRSIWNYPFGIAMVTLYAWIFFGAKLYADTVLQVFFFVVQIYGWVYWLKNRDTSGLVVVRRLTKTQAIPYAITGVAGIAVIGTGFARFTDASFPYWDSTILVLSVIAQILLARRRLENWLVWIVVDALAIGLYWTKELYPTAVLYGLFFIIASIGYWSWRRAWARGEAVEA